MLEQLVKTLAQQTTAAMSPVVVPVNMGRDAKLIAFNGELHPLNQTVPPLDYHVETLADFVTLCERFKVQIVFVGMPNVVAFVDADKRLDKITWQRYHTPAFERLQEWAEGKSFEQQPLIALLRNELREAAGASSMLQSVRNLRFSVASDAASVANRGEESLSKEVLAKMSNAESLPEDLTVKTTVFTDQDPADFSHFKILVDPLPKEQKIRLQSLQDELDRVLFNGRLSLREQLTDALEEATVVLGQE